MKRVLYVCLFALGFACAGSLSAVVVAETLPTTGSTATATTTTPSTGATSTGATTATTATTTTTAPTTTTTPVTTTRATTTTRTTTTKPTKPTKPTTPSVVPPRVTVGGVAVGGLTPAAAVAAVRTQFASPLQVVVDRTRFRLDPRKYASAYVTGAVARARASKAGTRVDLVVAVRGRDVRSLTAKLAKRFERPVVDARLAFRDSRPVVTPDRTGRALDRADVTRRVIRALRTGARKPLRFETTVVRPDVTRASIGAVIVINRSLNRLSLYDGADPWRTFGVATGQSVYPTPRGLFSIVVKARNPWWYPPTSSEWARGLQPVPPGPGNPLGTRWMGLTAPGVGIHGTPDAASIGYSASHGCIRMRIPEAEWLFDHVGIGTPVLIV